MTPRRSGGISSGISTSSCPDAFETTVEQASFANDVIFLAVFLGITIALCISRKKSAGKGLLGLPLIGCLFFFSLTYVCSIISTVLLQCGTTSTSSYYDWQIALVIFTYISYWLLLVVVVFNLNAMLRRQLDVGHSNIILKIIPLVILGIMGVLSCALAGISAYIDYTLGASRRISTISGIYNVLSAQAKLRVAYYALYLVSELLSGGLALMTIFSLRKAGKAGGDLIGWVITLTMAMALWTILMIVFASWSLSDDYEYPWETSLALSYLVNLAQALSFIFILCIAKHASWRKPTAVEPLPYQSAYQPVQQYGYNANATGQAYQYHEAPTNVTGHAYQYHEAPEFVGTNNQVRA